MSTPAARLPADQQWWWCRPHERAEKGSGCAHSDRMGPYASEAEAQDWKQRAEARSEAWDDEDREWRA